MVNFNPWNGMFLRTIESKLLKALLRSPSVLLTGPRQSGKSTLVKKIGEAHNYHYITFDDLRYASIAKQDPIGFISDLPKPVILDEVQIVPEIYLTIKKDIDENRSPGRYLLTGSASPLIVPRLSDALVGRVELLNLYPLSQGEILGLRETFIDQLFSDEKFKQSNNTMSNSAVNDAIMNGGYPSVQNVSPSERESWMNSYISTILQRDIQEIKRISGIREFPVLLNLLATRAQNLLNVAELSRSTGIPQTTLHRYLAL
jgi:uncharacterized protein